MTTRTGVLAIIACALFAGCVATVPLQRAQTDALSKEVPASDVDRILGSATVVAQTEVSAGQKSYLARHYRLLTGTRQQMSMICAPTCFPTFTTVPVTSDYVVIQRMPSKELLAWGTLEELSKDPDSAVSSIMPAVKARLYEAQSAR